MATQSRPASTGAAAPVRRRGKLWSKFLTYFFVVSLGPLLFLGYTMIRTARGRLKLETLTAQQARAVSFANFVSDYINTYKNVLYEVAHTDGFAELPPAEQEATFNRLMQLHPPLLELSLVRLDGQEAVRLDRFKRQTNDVGKEDLSQKAYFVRALREGEYLGQLERFRNVYPTMLMALPIVDSTGQEAKGVLVGKINLNGLSQMLQQWFKDSSIEGALVGPAGFLIADSDLNKVFSADAKMPSAVLDVIMTRPEDKGGGELQVDGRNFLGTFATVKSLGWVVYVQQPLETAYSTAQAMEDDLIHVLGWTLLATVLLSFMFSSQLSHPIRTLKEAVGKLAAGEYEGIEVTMTNDELGELAQSFLTMAESIRGKTEEILSAKQEVEKLNRTLENRVEARTRELKAAQEELISKARLAAIGQMASVVGHEIRNPLAVINNSVYFIKTKLGVSGEVDPKIAKHLSIIESEIQQANGIINEILTFSRTRELKPAVHAINDFLEELVSIYPFPSHIQIVKTFAPENPNVFIDPDEMRQALRNLIGNAVEVMPTGGVLTITTELAPGQKDWVRIDVSDTGGGIPPEVVEKIFAPFFTTKARGTGLGLAVVRKVVDRHKGKVDVDSTVGKGTTFKIYLPLASKLPPAAAPQSAAAVPQPAPRVS